jgi:hypothetical protein
MTFRPRPVQRPRIPIWVAAAWPRHRSMARAARWDGLLAQAHDPSGANRDVTVDDVGAIHAWVGDARARDGIDGPFDIVVQAGFPKASGAQETDERAAYEAVGATWWLEADWRADSVAPLRRRIEQGPLRAG